MAAFLSWVFPLLVLAGLTCPEGFLRLERSVLQAPLPFLRGPVCFLQEAEVWPGQALPDSRLGEVPGSGSSKR